MQASIFTPAILRGLAALSAKPPREPGAPLSLLERARREWLIRFRDPEQGGYVHDTNMSQLIPINAASFVTGTWTDTAGAVTGTVMKRCTAAAATNDIYVPITLPQNAVALKGAFLKSMDFFWINGTAAFTTMAATIRHATLPANAAAYPTVVSEAFSYDAFHATGGNRVTVAQHTMTLTPTTPWWLANTDQLNVQLDFVNPGTAVLDYYGARANFTLRM